MRTLGLPLLFLALSQPAQAQTCTPETREEHVQRATILRECVQQKIEVLERSGERPQDIATAAITLCGQEMRDIGERCGGLALQEELDKRLRDLVVAEVVVARAARAAGAQ